MTRRAPSAAAASILLAAVFSLPGRSQNAQQPAPGTPSQPSSTQSQQQSGTPQAVPVPDESNLPEEDESVAPEKFDFNPLESKRNVNIGNYYWHKSKYRAALRRYEWATRYDPGSADAFYKVAEAENKLNNKDAERVALKKVMTLSPNSRLGREAKKRLDKS